MTRNKTCESQAPALRMEAGRKESYFPWGWHSGRQLKTQLKGHLKNFIITNFLKLILQENGGQGARDWEKKISEI